MEIVLNKCYGGFSLSKEAYDYLGLKWDGYGCEYNYFEKRTDPKLIECVKALGEKANGNNAYLEVIEIPDNIYYEINNYDGFETVSERHREW